MNDGCVPADHRRDIEPFTSRHDIKIEFRRIVDNLPDGPGIKDLTIERFDKVVHEKQNPFRPDGYTLKK